MRSSYLDTAPPCPSCKAVLDGVTDPTGKSSPKPGDLSVCKYCQALLCYTEDMMLRTLTVEEQNEVKRDYPDLWVKLNIVARYFRERKI